MPALYYTYNRISTSIKRMPINALRFYAEEVMGDEVGLRPEFYLDFFHLESESSYSINEITKPKSDGGFTTIAYRWEAKVYVPHNIYKNNTLISLLDSILLYGNYTVKIYLGTAVTPDVDNPQRINSDESMVLNLEESSFSYRIESVEYRPRMIISFGGITKTNLSLFQST